MPTRLDNFGLQEFEEVLKEANLTDSLELLSVAVEEGKLGEAVQEGEEGKEVISKMEQSYATSMQQVSGVVVPSSGRVNVVSLDFCLQVRAVLQRKRKHLESSRIPI